MTFSYKPLAGGILFALSTVIIAACNGGGNGPLPQSGGDSPTTQSLASIAATPVHWQIQAGASTLDQAFQDFDFYAHSITIDVGDSVTWRVASREPHTVTFLAPGQTPPPPGAPGALAPAGGSTENGSTFTSSGLMGVGGSYTLTFTKAGTYKFYCL